MRPRTIASIHRSSAARGAPRGRVGRPERLLSIVVLLTAAIVLAAPSPAGRAEPGAPSPGSAIVVVDDEGTSVTIPTPPERIVSLTPGTTEILFAVGAGSAVIATTDADDYPPEAVELPDVGSFGTVDLERIVDLAPDLVVAGGNGYTPADAIERLRSLDIPVVVVYAPTVEAVIGDIELLGEAVGRGEDAREVAQRMRDELDALTSTVRDLRHPRVFYEIDATVEIYGPADESFLAEMVQLAGGIPVTSGSPLDFAISLERLVAADPEVIVLGDAAYGTTPDDVAARPGWGGITAVREGAIRPVEDILVTRPGPRLPAGLRALIEAIHPDAGW